MIECRKSPKNPDEEDVVDFNPRRSALAGTACRCRTRGHESPAARRDGPSALRDIPERLSPLFPRTIPTLLHYLKPAILIGCTMSMAMGGENESSPQSAEAKPSPARLRELLAGVASLDGTYLLHRAANRGDLACVKLLLAAGADPNEPCPNAPAAAPGYRPLHVAESAEVMRALIDAGADLNACDAELLPPLFHAVAGADTPRVLALLSVGANINAQLPQTGGTVLHTAARKIGLPGGWRGDREECLRALMAHGAKRDATDNHGRTPLHDASLWNLSDVARILLEAGAEVNCADESGKTPLHLAAMGQGDDSAACLKLLLAAGADPNARDADGNSPLHEAAGVSSSERWGDRDAVRVLEEAGADPTLRNKDGQTPQELISHGRTLTP